MMNLSKSSVVFAVMVLSGVAFAETPQPYIWWKMDGIVDGKVRNSGTNDDERCDLTLGPGVTQKSLYGVDNAIYFDASKESATDAWAVSWTPALKSRTVSFWICRDANNDKIDTKNNTTHFVFSGLSRENVMVAPDNRMLSVKIGRKEGSKEEIAHSYFYKAVDFTRDAWHQIVVVLEDTGLTCEDEGDYYGNPVYNFYAYLDGVRTTAVEGRVTERDLDVASAFCFGNIAQNGVRPLPGAFSDVRIWDCALTENDVDELWEEESKTHAPSFLGFWRMEEVVTASDKRYVPDASGRGVPLEIGADNVLMDDAGISGKALDFPDSKACHGQAVNRATALRDFSLSFWMRPKTGMDKLATEGLVGNKQPNIFQFAGYFRCMFGNMGDSKNDIYLADMASVTNGNAAIPSYGNAYLAKGCWSHFTFVAKAEQDAEGKWSVTPKIYCNGELAVTCRKTTCPVFEEKGVYPADGKLILGNMGIGQARAMWGQMDDVAFFGSALTDEQVKRLYQGIPEAEAGDDFSVVGETARLAGRLSLSHGGDSDRAARQDAAVWSLVSAPEGALSTIVAPDDLNTTVWLPVPGEYVFRLTVSLEGLSAHDDVTVTRVAELPGSAPTVAVTAPSAATTDAGIPLSAVASAGARVFWSKVSGPGAVGFEPKEGRTTSVRFFAPGDYVLKATADDGERTISQEFSVSVVAGEGVDILTGLLGYWPLGGEKEEVLTKTVWNNGAGNYNYLKTAAGVDGYGTQVEDIGAKCIYTFFDLKEELLEPEGADYRNTIPKERWRSFSLWMKYDPQADTNNACGCVLVEAPYTLGLFYDKTNGIDRIGMYQNTLCTDVGGTGDKIDNYAASVPSFDNRWVHVYAAFDRQKIYNENASELWIDGVRQTGLEAKRMGGGRVNSGYLLQFGNINKNAGTSGPNDRWDNRPRTFPGVLDEIRLYNRKLTESEIRFLAANPVVDVNHAPAADIAAVPSGMVKGETAAVGAVAGDDGMPTGSALTGQWIVLSGNAADLVFADPAARETTATAFKAGTYTLAYKVSDGEKTTYSDPQTFGVAKPGLMLILK